jgi:hypothetical protein
MNTSLGMPCEKKASNGIYLELETLESLAKNTADIINGIAAKFSPSLLDSLPSDCKTGVLDNAPHPAISPVERRLKEIQDIIRNNNIDLSDILNRCRL